MLSTQELLLLIVVFAAVVVILSGKLRADLVALLVLLTLGILRIVTPEEALSGFSSPAIITIVGLFIISHGLEETGVIQWIADRLRQLGGGNEARLVMIIMAAGSTLALFMNIIAAGAVLLPAVVNIARDSNVRASKLLIPLSYGTLIGATATYFASANIILSTLLVERGLPGLGISDFVPTGSLIIIAGLLYMALIGRRLLPERESVGQNASPRSLSRTLYETYKLEERLWEVRVLPGSRLVEVPLSRCSIGEELGLTVLAIWRGPQAILTPEPMEVIHSGDYLLMLGREERVAKLSEWGVSIGRENGHVNPRHDYSVDLTEVVIPPRSSAIGKSLSELRFRNKYGLTTVALWREGRSYRTDVGTFPLEVGDALLMVGPASRIKSLAQDRDFLVLQSSHAIRPRNPQKAPWALLILAAVVLASLFRIVPAAEAMLAGAAAMVLTGCLNMDEAYRAVEWRVVFLIAGMLPISIALYQTGLSAAIGGTLVDMLAPYGGLALIAGLFIFTMLIVQVMGGQVTSLIVGPIAVSAALQFGMNPQAIAVATATACATAFLTPMAHPVNVLMMGPGGYKPGDFTRVGIGMTVVVFVMLLVGMAVFWGVR